MLCSLCQEQLNESTWLNILEVHTSQPTFCDKCLEGIIEVKIIMLKEELQLLERKLIRMTKEREEKENA